MSEPDATSSGEGDPTAEDGGSTDPSDPEDDGTGNDDGGDEGSDPDDEPREEPELARPTGDTVTACIADDGILGYCGDNPLLRACDESFVEDCAAAGGYLGEVPEPQETVEVCDNDNVFTPACTDDWFTSCKDFGGTPECINHGADGGCVEAQCCFPGDC